MNLALVDVRAPRIFIGVQTEQGRGTREGLCVRVDEVASRNIID